MQAKALLLASEGVANYEISRPLDVNANSVRTGVVAPLPIPGRIAGERGEKELAAELAAFSDGSSVQNDLVAPIQTLLTLVSREAECAEFLLRRKLHQQFFDRSPKIFIVGTVAHDILEQPFQVIADVVTQEHAYLTLGEPASN